MSARLALNTLLIVAIMACVAGAVVLIVRDSGSPNGVEIQLPPRSPTATSDVIPIEIQVHVTGAVSRPGVYRLQPDARAIDALNAAGGPTADANIDRVNLAVKLKDEFQLYIPSDAVDPAARDQPGPLPTAEATGKLDLNTATAEELESLPGIGSGKAAAIVDYRATNGPFRRVDDLVLVSGIGEGILGSIRHLVEAR